MKRIIQMLTMVAAVVAVLALSVVPALAASPHFVKDPTCTLSSNGTLTCSGKAAGLGNGPTAAYLTAESVTANYECVNRGGNVAPGQPTSSDTVTGTKQTIQPRNGQISFSPTLSPPATPTSQEAGCPNGNWKVNRTSLTYTGVVLHIEQPPGTEILTSDLGNFSA